MLTNTRFIVAALICALSAQAASAADSKRTWNFENDKVGEIAHGFTNEVGKWVVTDSGDGKVLMQTAKNPNSVFNATLIPDVNVADVDISVKLKAVAGEIDQGGGIVWRAKDAKNYYLARYNPLEDNYRLYKVINGKRILLENVDIAHSDGWHTLQVKMSGDHITCSYDGKQYLEHRDTSITDAEKIGLWTKADAQSQFDELTLVGK